MTNAEIDEALTLLPDKVAEALEAFKVAGLENQRIRAKAYLDIKARSVGSKTTVADIEAQVEADDECYKAALEEIKAESAWTRVYERLMAAKKLATLREAF